MKLLGPSMLRFVGSVLCIVIAVVSWIIMAEKLQGLFTSYPKSYFMVYWIHSWYSLMYVAWKAWREFPGGFQCNSVGDGTINWKKALGSSAFLGVVSLLAAYFWYLSLPHTSVPANTAIYQSAVAFTFIFSVPILREKVTVVKVLAVTLSITGVVLVAIYSEKKDKTSVIHQTALGYVYLVVSTVLFALMEVLFKKFSTTKDDPASACNGVRFIGLIGVHTIVWMWPPLILLHYTGIEHFSWPSQDLLVLLFVNAILDVLFNASIFVCIALSSPLFASVGTVTAIPTSIIVDFFIHHTSAYFVVYIGMSLIAVGFVGFSISEFIQMRQESKEEEGEEEEKDNSSLTHSTGSITKGHSINAEESSEKDYLLASNSSLRRKRWKHFVLKYVV